MPAIPILRFSKKNFVHTLTIENTISYGPSLHSVRSTVVALSTLRFPWFMSWNLYDVLSRKDKDRASLGDGFFEASNGTFLFVSG